MALPYERAAEPHVAVVGGDEQVVHHRHAAGGDGVVGQVHRGEAVQLAVLLGHELHADFGPFGQHGKEGVEPLVGGLRLLVEVDVGAHQLRQARPVARHGAPDAISRIQASRSCTLSTPRAESDSARPWSRGPSRCPSQR